MDVVVDVVRVCFARRSANAIGLIELPVGESSEFCPIDV
jgi:hypothetical protein